MQNLTAEQISALKSYQSAVLAANESFNLIGKHTAEDFWTTHIEDSLSVLNFVNFSQNATLLDVGSGAGFPAVPLKIARADLQVATLDATLKRVDFVQSACTNINIKINTITARAEELGHNINFREKYDFVVARAVAELRPLAELCLPFVKTGGKFIALKGPGLDVELEFAAEIIEILGGKVKQIHRFSLADGSARRILIVKKEKSAPATHPRRWSKIIRG